MLGSLAKNKTAMLLAAGRGERMKPLTDTIPKPLVEVAGSPLIKHHLNNLSLAGVSDFVVNHAHLGDKIIAMLQAYSEAHSEVAIRFSPEPLGGLETAGGIIKALPILNTETFLVVNADVWTDYDFSLLANHGIGNNLAHLVLVDTPFYKKKHDFFLDEQGVVNEKNQGRGLTFAGISLLSRALFDGLDVERRPLPPLFREAIKKGKVTGEYFTGDWEDVGTVERLEKLRARLT